MSETNQPNVKTSACEGEVVVEKDKNPTAGAPADPIQNAMRTAQTIFANAFSVTKKLGQAAKKAVAEEVVRSQDPRKVKETVFRDQIASLMRGGLTEAEAKEIARKKAGEHIDSIEV